jgi:hypothetical protein
MSRKVLTAILTGVSLITAAASERADDFACPVAAPAEVKIKFARSAEHVETDISLQQLREAAEGHHSGPVLGLYVGTLRYGIEIDDTIRRLARVPAPHLSMCRSQSNMTVPFTYRGNSLVTPALQPLLVITRRNTRRPTS